jgi:hypothetical protein
MLGRAGAPKAGCNRIPYKKGREISRVCLKKCESRAPECVNNTFVKNRISRADLTDLFRFPRAKISNTLSNLLKDYQFPNESAETALAMLL